jgi:hypothetical protein
VQRLANQHCALDLQRYTVSKLPRLDAAARVARAYSPAVFEYAYALNLINPVAFVASYPLGDFGVYPYAHLN